MRSNDIVVQIIEALGGVSATAEKLNKFKGNSLTYKAVARWYDRDNPGVPTRYNGQLVQVGGEEVRQMLLELNDLKEYKGQRK